MAAISIDSRLLPQRALVDSGVLIRALGDRPNDLRTPACEAFYNAMIAHRRDILVAAPSVAEMLRHKPKRDVPRVQFVTVVPFDRKASQILGDHFPHHLLVTIRDEMAKKAKNADLPLNYFKYDAMVVACAIRHAADVVVTCDTGMVRLAELVKIAAKGPQAYADKQLSLPNTLPQPARAGG